MLERFKPFIPLFKKYTFIISILMNILLFGTALNMITCTDNAGKMPVAFPFEYETATHISMYGHNTTHYYTSDIFTYKINNLSGAFSIGDILLVVGGLPLIYFCIVLVIKTFQLEYRIKFEKPLKKD